MTTVTAIVLTFDAPEALRRCLAAISAQTHPVDAVLVVDNASATPVDDLVAAVPGGRVLRLGENLGPAGGYAAGLDAFAASDSEWAWVIDDDSAPAPDALEHQLAEAGAGAASPRVVLATMIDAESGALTNTQGWCAVLIPRAVVEAVGVPNAALFWWTEDTEYLQWRIPRAGFDVVRSDDAIVRVARARAQRSKPAWKYYYEARNQVYYRLTTQRVPDRPVPRHLRLRVRGWRAVRSITKLGARAVAREHDGRVDKLAMVARGAVDGARGRLGRTVPVDTADRPLAPDAGDAR